MGSINDVIDAFRRAPTNVDRGTLFEKLMVRFFELDPALNQQYEQVWRWIDWPDRQGKPDTGIDLVARERDTGDYTAIQCKFYEPTHTLAKADIDSFFTASGKKPFTNRVIVSTTDKWGKNAEAALEDQTIPVQRVSLADIAESPIEWDIAWPQDGLSIELSPAERKKPRPHQEKAIEAVLAGFEVGNDRGKLIMACGTGKTFTALKLAERIAADTGDSARILFLVPSISLLSQSLREWTAQTELDMRAFAVCSDTKVGRLRNTEDFNVHDVPIPVTTNPATLMEAMAHRKRAKGLTVVFSTYQSLPTVAEAQTLGVDDFDLVICDEAHRTTGVTLAGEDESNFVRVHDADYLHAKFRLYMTATPRIFDDAVKGKADDHSAELVSMDDEFIYGPEFHRLTFGDAVERGLLSDYKVLVLTVDRSVMAPRLQRELAGVAGELQLDDASKIVGCWNGLAKRAGTAPDGTGFAAGEPPMRRAVAFARDIKTSQQLAQMFPLVVEGYSALLDARENDGDPVDDTNRRLRCEVRHVDGTYNALERNAELMWLKGVVAEDECRILTNARCLSEGVDVPALDAVLFLNPRNSVVDVVQSVGRVMRKAPGKDYGYVILPVAVPEGVEPSVALEDNQRFKVVWQVLNALRSHDERFDAMVNSIALNTESKSGQGTQQLLGGHLGPTLEDPGPGNGDDKTATATQMALFSLSQWQEAIYTRIVDKVGTRTYWEQWANDVADIAAVLITRITALLAEADPAITAGFEQFLTGLRDNLNDSITSDEAVSMLAQHLITKPVFDALFAGHEFAAHNPVSQAMQTMVDTLGAAGLEAETTRLEGFYASVRRRAGEVASAEGKQQVIAELYEKFFRVGFKKQAEGLGIVYTPVEIVDFILRSADTVSRKHFGRGLTDEGVHVLDGFVGTGTFITRLLQSGLVTAADLARKYTHELHANEIMLLAYYIAAVNIETTYHALAGKTTDTDDYEPFNGIVLADTFQIHEADDSLDAVMFPQNNDRIVAQLATPINVIVGNPPYSVGQDSANDDNPNVIYPTLDDRIRATYLVDRKRGGSNSMFDSYIRAIRWATDRIGETGIVAFVVNGGWIDANTANGMRLSLADDYTAIYIYNLRGNGRIAGERGRKEGRPIFEFGGWRPDGSEIKSTRGGSRATIAIVLLVKTAVHGRARIHYTEVADYLSAGEKIRAISDAGEFAALTMRELTPNSHGDWLNQRDDQFSTFPAIGDKRGEAACTVFSSYSRGLETGRDAWVYNFSKPKLSKNIRNTVEFFETVQRDYETWLRQRGVTRNAPSRDEFVKQHSAFVNDPKKFSWTLSARNRLSSGTRMEFSASSIRRGTYRPFNTQWVYNDRSLNHIVGRLPSMFPTPHHTNIGFYVVGSGSEVPFSAIMLDLLPNLHVTGAGSGGQFFPRWTYEKDESEDGALDFASVDGGEVDEYGYRRVDNITDAILALYRDAIGDQVSKDDIFYYVYGLLHDPDYRSTYAADLKKMLPHIPTPVTRERFAQLAEAGRKLADLHVNYETTQPYPLDVQLKAGADPANRETWRVQKMKWAKKKDPATGKNVDDTAAIIYNPKVTIAGIPEAAEQYMLGSRSALAWIIDRYQVKTDKASGIVNDPNDWCDEHDDPTYIIDLIKKITTVSMETVKIVEALSPRRA